MFEGLKWKPAARRSAIVIAIYLGLLYVLSRVFPNSNFNLDTWTDAVRLLVNAAIFFFIFTFIYALLERRRGRQAEEARKDDRGQRRSCARRHLAQGASQPQHQPQEVPPSPLGFWTSTRLSDPRSISPGSLTSSPSSPSPASCRGANTTILTPWITSSR